MLDVEAAHPGERAAGDDDVVEGVMRRPARLAAAGQDAGLERHPLVDRELARDELAEDRLELVASTFERKPTLPRLTPSSGTSTSVTARAARRNVPSPPRTTRTSVVGSSADERLEVLGLGGPVVDAAHLAPARGPLAELDRGVVRRVVGEADPARHASCRRLPRAISVADLGAGRPRREVDEELAVALRPEDRRGDHGPRAQAQRPRRWPRPARGPRGGPPGRGRRRGPSCPGRPRTGA